MSEVATRDGSDKMPFDIDRLASYLAQHVEGFQGPMSLSRFKGGQSNPKIGRAHV